MGRIMATLAAAGILAAPAYATDITALSPAERAAFGRAVAQYLHANPQVIADAMEAAQPKAPDLYAEDRESDLSLIAQHGQMLFDRNADGFGPTAAPVVIALIRHPDCASCDTAEADLRALSKQVPFRTRLLSMEEAAPFMAAMDLTDAPAYVFENMVLSGAMPPAVIERYIKDRLP